MGNWSLFFNTKQLTPNLLLLLLCWAIGLLFEIGQPAQASAGPVPIASTTQRIVTNTRSLTITNPVLMSPCKPFDACSGPNCPGTYSGTVFSVYPPNEGYSGTDDNFNVIVKGNFIVPVDGGAETEGRVLVGGNFSMNRDYYGAGTSGGGTFVVGPDGEANLIVRGAIQRTVGTAGVLVIHKPGIPLLLERFWWAAVYRQPLRQVAEMPPIFKPIREPPPLMP